jgi:hypothetical protein
VGGRRTRPVPGCVGWRTIPTPRGHALIGAAVTRNPRAASTRLCVARGTRPCLGRPTLEAGDSPRATCVVERGPRRRAPVGAHGAALGDCAVSAPRHRHRQDASSGSRARPHPQGYQAGQYPCQRGDWPGLVHWIRHRLASATRAPGPCAAGSDRRDTRLHGP